MDATNNIIHLNQDDIGLGKNKPIDMDVQNASEHTARIGDALIKNNTLNAADVEKIMALQTKKNILFGEAAIELGLINEHDLNKVLSQQFKYTYMYEDKQHISPALVAAHAPFSVEAENLRSLRGQLLIRWFDQGHKTLAVTSTTPNDNASEVAANLAIVFSQLNKNTLLIDANLRQASQHKLFKVETKLGLANILANRQGTYALMRQQSLPNLSILSAGTAVPNPQELLSQTAFAELLHDLESVYDVIIIDTAPLDLGSDVLTVVSKAKAAIIVAKKDHTLAEDIQQLNLQLNMTGASIVGCVIQDAA